MTRQRPSRAFKDRRHKTSGLVGYIHVKLPALETVEVKRLLKLLHKNVEIFSLRSIKLHIMEA